MRIGTNIAAMNAIESGSANNKLLANSLEKLSTGLAINKASDDASGMAIADKLRTQKSSLMQSISNGNSAVALIQIADKAMGEQSNILDIVKTKLLQAGSDTTSDSGRQALAKDINKLLTQLDGIASQTNYNGISLLQAGENSTDKASTLSFQLGENENDKIQTSSDIQSNTKGLGHVSFSYNLQTLLTRTDGDGSILTKDHSSNYLQVVDKGLTDLNTMRSDFGSVENQIESSLRNITTATTNISAAESVIRDVDFAKESANFNRLSIIGNGSNYALSQANTRPKDVLTLLQ
jgi:flagellin